MTEARSTSWTNECRPTPRPDDTDIKLRKKTVYKMFRE